MSHRDLFTLFWHVMSMTYRDLFTTSHDVHMLYRDLFDLFTLFVYDIQMTNRDLTNDIA